MKIVVITKWGYIHVVNVKDVSPIQIKNISGNDEVCVAFPFIEESK